MELKAFVTNLGKYNEGVLCGEWVYFPINEDEFSEKVLPNIGVDGKRYEEWFITDYECELDGVAEYLGEYPSLEEVNALTEAIESWDEDYAQAVVDVYGFDYIINYTQDDFLFVNAETDEDIGEYYINETEMAADIPEWLTNYIDYEAYGRDVRFDSDGGFSNNGYFVERI